MTWEEALTQFRAMPDFQKALVAHYVMSFLDFESNFDRLKLEHLRKGIIMDCFEIHEVQNMKESESPNEQ